MHIGNIRLPNVFEKGPVTVKMPIDNQASDPHTNTYMYTGSTN